MNAKKYLILVLGLLVLAGFYFYQHKSVLAENHGTNGIDDLKSSIEEKAKQLEKINEEIAKTAIRILKEDLLKGGDRHDVL